MKSFGSLILIATTTTAVPTFSEELPADFNFLGDPVAEFSRPFAGVLITDRVKVASALDAPLRPIAWTSPIVEDNEMAKITVVDTYPVFHAGVLITGLPSSSETAYSRWEQALRDQFINSQSFSNAGGPNYGVYVIVTDIRMSAPLKSSTARVQATYRIVNIDDNTDLLELEIETLENGISAFLGSSEELQVSALNHAVRENISVFFEQLRTEVERIY